MCGTGWVYCWLNMSNNHTNDFDAENTVKHSQIPVDQSWFVLHLDSMTEFVPFPQSDELWNRVMQGILHKRHEVLLTAIKRHTSTPVAHHCELSRSHWSEPRGSSHHFLPLSKQNCTKGQNVHLKLFSCNISLLLSDSISASGPHTHNELLPQPHTAPAVYENFHNKSTVLNSDDNIKVYIFNFLCWSYKTISRTLCHYFHTFYRSNVQID